MRPLARRCLIYITCQIIYVSAGAGQTTTVLAQEGLPPADAPSDSGSADGDEAEAPQRVAVNPVAKDDEIAARLQRILAATEWFESPRAEVDEGVVFLTGTAEREEQRQWAADLARNTEDVVAVVNRISVRQPSAFDIAPAKAEVDRLARDTIRVLPSAVIALVVLVLAYGAAKAAFYISRFFASRRIANTLLQQMTARAVAVAVGVIGLYLALRVSGLTRLAATVLGGTGLIGLAVGIAFRDIAENYLASMLISVKRPFRMGDLILVDDKQGYVQSVTTRGTMLMTLEGNHVQIPNAIIYKSVIQNLTANPNMRFDFLVGIDYGDRVREAQHVILTAMKQHDAVLTEPEPLVLVDQLASSTVSLQVLFWVNTQRHSGLKVRSAVIRRVKQALDQSGFTLPDEAREVIFPHGVPVLMNGQQGESAAKARPAAAPALGDQTATSSPRAGDPTDEPEATPAEGSLVSEREEVQRQADTSASPDAGENLIAH